MEMASMKGMTMAQLTLKVTLIQKEQMMAQLTLMVLMTLMVLLSL
jgi:hypothetical protein